jgi:hypothetical protein
MAWTEEIFENDGKLFGSNTGKEYSKSETEEKGAGRWAKPCYAAPGELVLEVDSKGQSMPHGNGAGKKFTY